MGEKYFFVAFKWYNSNTYCTNIVIAENQDIVEQWYNKTYGWCHVRIAYSGEVETAKLKGMPIVKIHIGEKVTA